VFAATPQRWFAVAAVLTSGVQRHDATPTVVCLGGQAARVDRDLCAFQEPAESAQARLRVRVRDWKKVVEVAVVRIGTQGI
jgi:hypothetical protein